MVKEIATVSGKKIRLIMTMKPFVYLAGKMHGKIGGLINKAFGNNCYAHELSVLSGAWITKNQFKRINYSYRGYEKRAIRIRRIT